MDKTYRDPLTGKMLAERRTGMDRRYSASLFASLASRHRRRKSRGRRITDRGAYVDIYDSRTWGIVIAILLLSLMDALLTGLHMVGGSARELNPILNAVLAHGGLPAFFSVKAAMTILPVAIIMIHKEWTLGKHAARLCLWAYILLSFYHLYLIFGVQTIGSLFLARAT
jgi:hypothetical protein